jgi:hypothetical protein
MVTANGCCVPQNLDADTRQRVVVPKTVRIQYSQAAHSVHGLVGSIGRVRERHLSRDLRAQRKGPTPLENSLG